MEQNSKLMLNTKEKILRQVLHQFDIPNNAFSIGSSAEQRVCLEKRDDKFHVYVVERGIKFDESQHQTEDAAHFEMLHQLAATDSEYHRMRDTYKQMLERSRENILLKTLTKRVTPIGQPVSTPNIVVGDVVRVCIKDSQGLRQHSQVFEGTVISQKRSRVNNCITVRHTAYGVAVEKEFSLSAPNISKVEIVRKGKNHRTKSYSLRKQKYRVNVIKKK